MKTIKEYKGTILLAINLVLLVVILFGQNALNIFKSGYDGADPIVSLDEDHIASIQIADPDNRGTIIELIRLDKKRKLPQKSDTQDKTEPSPQFVWKLATYPKADSTDRQEFDADYERIKAFLEGLENTRDYYALTRTSKRDVELEMDSNSAGQYKGLKLVIQKSGSSKKYTLYVGKTSARGSQSYVRLDDEDKIYLVETNLRSITGSGETQYFRNRRVFPENLESENITMVDASFNDNKNVQLSRQATNWFITAPVQKEADKSLVNAFVSDLSGWKASAFFDKLPEDADPASKMRLTVYYNHTGNITDQLNLPLVVYAKKSDSNNYYVQIDGQKNWLEINSVYLEDLRSPLVKFVKRKFDQNPGSVDGLLQ